MAYNNQLGSKLNTLVGEALSSFTKTKFRPGLERIKQIKFSEEYQGRIIDCMVGEVDDNYIETPETDSPIVKLEHSKEGLVKVPNIKGKTILVDADGNETDTPAEGCRLVSVGEDEDNKLTILSKNKNLFNEKNFIVKTGSSWHYVDIKNLPTVVFNGKGYARLQHNYSKLEFYTTNKLPTGNAYDEWQLKGAMDVPYNVEGNIRFNVNNNLNHKYLIIFQASTDLNNYVFREFSVTTEIPTTYIEPKHHKTEILLDEPLRSLPDGTCDEIVGNKLIKRLIQLNLKGTENITTYKEGDDYFRVVIADKRLRGEWDINKTYCNKLLYNHYDAYWVLSECIALDSNGQLYICLPKNELSSCSIEGVREYLRNNNIQIIATLAEPIIEELPNGITLQGYDETTMYIENSITPTVSYGYNALIPYKEELLTQKEEVETNTLDIENNIIPYLMDMEYNLMLMGEDI